MTKAIYPQPSEMETYNAPFSTPIEKLDFNSLYHQFSAYVAAVALRLSGDPSCVDDIVQEVFLDCYKSINSISSTCHARRWLVKVTVRKTKRRLQMQKLKNLFVPAPSRVDEIPMPGLSADDRAAFVQLFGILDTVPVNQRLAWSLRYLEGAELSETAESCGCSLATAKRWIRAVQCKITGVHHDG